MMAPELDLSAPSEMETVKAVSCFLGSSVMSFSGIRGGDMMAETRGDEIEGDLLDRWRRKIERLH